MSNPQLTAGTPEPPSTVAAEPAVAWARLGVIFTVALLIEASSTAQTPAKVNITWDKVVRVSKTTPALQVVVNPPLRRGSSIHDHVFQTLRDLGCDYVRYVPWLPYPKLGVAELDPGELLQMLVQEPGVIDHGLQDERLAQRNGGAVATVNGARGELRARRDVAFAGKRANRR